jgi:hypothetical protein
LPYLNARFEAYKEKIKYTQEKYWVIINCMKAFLTKLFIIILKIIVTIVKIFICLSITLFVGYFAAIASVVAAIGRQGFDWQVLLYVLVSAFTILGIWLIAFIKTKKNTKIIYAIIFLIWLLSPRILPSVMRQFDYDTCVDIGICTEGLKFSDGVMNKEYCITKSKKWDSERKVCDMRIEMRTCEKQGYEWNIKEGKCSHKIIKYW